MIPNEGQDRTILENIARRVMSEKGLLPDFSSESLAQLEQIQSSAFDSATSIRDMRDLLWASIDNDDSLDLDQLTLAVPIDDQLVKILVAVADVDALVKDSTPLDLQARHNTTSVYTPAQIFPMLPEKLSTNLTSLNQDADRLAVVAEMSIKNDGSIQHSEVYRALVRNKAKLAYNNVAAWLDGQCAIPAQIALVEGLADNLRRQDQAAQNLKNFRHEQGALSFETVEAKPILTGNDLTDLQIQTKNRATDLIENFMISANGATVVFLTEKGFPCIRRVVRIPERWDRIVQLAAEHAFNLPVAPDSKTLEQILLKIKAEDPLHFPDLSLAVIKLLGPGEYVAELPGGNAPGHFGLAVKDYDHSTAPNRRYPDIITQRLLKAAMDGKAIPYSKNDLDALAAHCTLQEDAAKKVERQVNKSAEALLLQSRIGEQFDAIITGAADKGTWVRLLSIPVEGKLVEGFAGVDVGNRIRVQLMNVDVQQGFIDFKKIH